jgi:hypothetical protein
MSTSGEHPNTELCTKIPGKNITNTPLPNPALRSDNHALLPNVDAVSSDPIFGNSRLSDTTLEVLETGKDYPVYIYIYINFKSYTIYMGPYFN